MPKTHCAAPELASLLDGSTAGELIPELARHGLQQLIELEVAAVIGADRHERTEERHGYRNGYRQRSLTTQVGDLEHRPGGGAVAPSQYRPLPLRTQLQSDERLGKSIVLFHRG